MTPQETAQWFRKAANELPGVLQSAESKTLDQGEKILIKWSSGTVGAAQQASMARANPVDGRALGPFSTSRATPLLPAEKINVQKGVFRDSWRRDGPFRTFGVIRSLIENIASYAGFMHGTAKMVERPIIEAAEAEIEPIRRRNIEQALNKALKP